MELHVCTCVYGGAKTPQKNWFQLYECCMLLHGINRQSCDRLPVGAQVRILPAAKLYSGSCARAVKGID
jgi:hypothetical protein